MDDDLPVGSGPVARPSHPRPDAQSRYAAELCGGQNSRAVWEVIDRTRKPLSRVICRTNRADAMMIVEALNHSAAADEIINRGAEKTIQRMISPAESIANS